jgi:putative spermidine/putrescine transport system ATP-binding protein
LSNLDAKLREEMQVELRAIQRRVGTTTIMVTHDQAEALATCDRIAVMDAGRIVQLADPLALYDRPDTPFAASFVGKSSQLAGRVGRIDGRFADVVVEGCGIVVATPVTSQVSTGDRVILALRPEKVTLLKPGESGTIQGSLVSRIFQGSSWLYAVDTPAGQILACELHRGAPAFSEGDTVSIAWRPEAAVLLPGDAARG